jgi:hypothetical protein
VIGCASTQQDPATTSAPDSADNQAIWRFDFVDSNNESLGYLVLAFTNDEINEPTCGNDHWKKMVVIDDELDFDLGMESSPAYFLNGPWLTIDLTASYCYIDHMLIGEMTPNTASGFFNYSHQLGGYNIGRFTAWPNSGTGPAELEATSGCLFGECNLLKK